MVCVVIFAFATSLTQQVAFVGNDHIYVIGLDGKGLKQITAGPVEDHDPVWSPDGSFITFTRVPGHKKGELRSDGHLYTIHPNGTDLTQLTSGPVYDGFLSWSPSISRFTFLRQESQSRLYEFDIRSMRISRQKLPLNAPARSPNGKWIAHIVTYQTEGEGPAEIWLTDSPNRKGHPLTHFGGPIGEPVWSPDGMNKKRLTNHWGDDFSPQWTRNGRFILIQSDRGMKRVEEGITGSPSSQLMLVDVDGKGEHVIPVGLSCSSIALSP